MNVSRRKFLSTTAGASAALIASGLPLGAAQFSRSVGANDRLSIGIIGTGDRGIGTHIEKLHRLKESMNVEVTAICDIWKIAREKASAKCEEYFGRKPLIFQRAEDLLARNDIDAVFIATPDHHHTRHLAMAAEAGRHCYVEKPLGIDMDGLNTAFDAVKKSGIICQVGTQLRSLPAAEGGRRLFESGVMGDIVRIEESRNADKPYWYQYINPEVKKEDLDWEEFLGGRSDRKFDPVVYSAWYGYYEFSQGPVPQWGVHYLDYAFHLTGLGIPDSCMCHGGITTWVDEHQFTVPDNIMATYLYKNGPLVTTSNQFGNDADNARVIYTNKGILRFQDWMSPTYSPEGGKDRDGSIRGIQEVEKVEQPDHWENFIECLRTNNTPNAPIEAGYQHAVCSIMAQASYESRKRVVFDPATRTVRAG